MLDLKQNRHTKRNSVRINNDDNLCGARAVVTALTYHTNTFLDSSNFIAGPLAEFPKTFDLKELKKGYFPHFFNTSENQNYIGELPAAKYYGPDVMKTKQREAFLAWHTSRINENYVFDFQRELHDYCDSDVDILRRGCLEFRKEFLEIANIDPLQYLTIASVCMSIYRSKYIPEKTIAVVEENPKDTYSRGSITWLNQFSNVRHALNGGEITICGNKVDGYDNVTNTVYQYHGCFWHGCPKCYRPTTIKHVNHETMDDLYEKTQRRSQQLKDAGYSVVEMWECNWLTSKEYKTAKNVDIDDEPLNPRESFFGGRTNAAKLKVIDKRMQYIDVVSLYPTVQYYDPFPIGHPTKIRRPSEYDPTWFGLVKCKILPPRKLYHPVLPIKTDKLVFTLCRKCLHHHQSEKCEHTEEERTITGCWTTLEIKKALEKGYVMQEIIEVWHFPEQSTYLFRDYINDFMKIKLETSPHNYESNEAYARIIKEQTGIELDLNKIGVNPGRRAIAKICLNSLWGKFGQRLNMSQSEFVTDPKRWYEILLDDKIHISNCIFVNEDVVHVTYKYKDMFVEDSTSTNIFIATFTTSNARLRLYDMLDRLGEDAVYYDTDSIIYIDNGQNTVPTGSMLGEWSSELADGDYIIEWMSTGPKSYYYKTLKGIEVTKIKGFTLNYENGLKLNRDAFNNIISGTSKEVVLKYDQIIRDAKTKELITRKRISKAFRMDYKKRKFEGHLQYDTVPWRF
ncbi:uncharacterized protein LOC108743448 [Agrilus planipennis]|uniref:DNA-directed DNA polymerase n=1 Tax=Agrilus planipennis TaxID=224129 RepID=A0A1W4XPV2_AGRPL|nr:uncharacterized protein LOC108743448 [Agrilus planipennis]